MGYTGDKKREYDSKWMAKRRHDFFKDKECVKCNSKENLELDHIDPKLKTSHNIWSWSEERRLAEIAKCQVLCEKCHKEKTIAYITKPIEHGTYSGYCKKCRCNKCVTAAREFWKIEHLKYRG